MPGDFLCGDASGDQADLSRALCSRQFAAADCRGGCHPRALRADNPQMLLDVFEAADTDLSRLKMVIGGSALPEGLAAAALARGLTSMPAMAFPRPVRC